MSLASLMRLMPTNLLLLGPESANASFAVTQRRTILLAKLLESVTDARQVTPLVAKFALLLSL